VFVEAFNATNATNLTGYLNIKELPTFGRPTSASERRRLQVGLRIDLR
jgi:hypothetical protein